MIASDNKIKFIEFVVSDQHQKREGRFKKKTFLRDSSCKPKFILNININAKMYFVTLEMGSV